MSIGREITGHRRIEASKGGSPRAMLGCIARERWNPGEVYRGQRADPKRKRIVARGADESKISSN